MNYRHHFHAGNFADVMKHVLLLQLMRALQAKEKGFLHLDTHAGRGRYDLAAAATGDSLARKPEWPDGIGRLWGRTDLPPAIAEYVGLVREFDRRAGHDGTQVQSYPGSPWIARLAARQQDRLVLCEKHPEECAALRGEFARSDGVTVQETDGYVAIRASLPPPERRALILIDPPFEAQDEFAQMTTALAQGLQRFASGVFALWYPLTERARLEDFFRALRDLKPPPMLVAELLIAGEDAPLKMKGCGLVVLNPPWQFDREAAGPLRFLAEALQQAPGARGRVEWLVAER
ncbi:MAG TPA: 23S rRNA (adenine(2030)-N(6))-methyltransferase RlmJ [Opitutaceae bacterium]|nr:23S rRNA (adenine(2030)-N(6))-methyltransferase RlmJ [Opitutaceae bacterium]